MPRKHLAILGLLISASSTQDAGAQGVPSRTPVMPDSAQMSAMMGRALRRMQPAQFVLDHREELALTPEQLPFIESLALAQVDSARVRNARRIQAAMTAARTTPLSERVTGSSTWTGPIDEDAIRQMSRTQAEQSAEIQIDLARDRHAIGAVLTPSQISMLVRIESADMMPPAGVRGVGVVMAPRISAATQPAASSDFPYFEYQVDKQATSQSGTQRPTYPEALRATRTRGDVLAQFIVDTTGQYRVATFKVLKSSNPLFTQAVKDALPQMRFTPAEKGGHKVPQLVQESFAFDPEMK